MIGQPIVLVINPSCLGRPVRWALGPVTERTTPSNVQPPKRHRKRVDMILQDHQQVVVRPRFVDAAGNEVAAPAGDVLTWRSSDEAILTVTDQGDGSALVATTGTLGTAAVTLSDDETGDGQPEFIGSLAIDVVTGPVVAIEINADTPTERP